MTKTDTVEVMSFPGEHYPENCLKCYELLRENYGSTKFDKCSNCQFADVRNCNLIVIRTDRFERYIEITRE